MKINLPQGQELVHKEISSHKIKINGKFKVLKIFIQPH
jgi:hypothetical protein